MISLYGPELGTFEAMELIKHTSRICGERKQYKKATKTQKIQNPMQKFRQSCTVFEKPGILFKKLKTLTCSNYHRL